MFKYFEEYSKFMRLESSNAPKYNDVLIDESGKVVDVQYGRDIGHHYNFDKIKKFSLS